MRYYAVIHRVAKRSVKRLTCMPVGERIARRRLVRFGLGHSSDVRMCLTVLDGGRAAARFSVWLYATIIDEAS